MATRPIFIPKANVIGVTEKMIEFQWHSGFATSQKQKSVEELHMVAKNNGLNSVLEASSKSLLELGVKLSAFNLTIETKRNNNKFTVETAFQGSKVFEHGGPFKDLFGFDSLAAKKDLRLKQSGNLVSFEFFGMEFPLVPRTYFYDWLYINALMQHSELTDQIMDFDGYSDIEFNPKKSINCQAHAIALFVSLVKNGVEAQEIKNPQEFLSFCSEHYTQQNRHIVVQSKMF
ncbi:hypothetical protein QNE85_002258 [Vibrio fluvialis]|nr:hypothetical protein [Vibrio fluvialis]ELV8646979.1 hypothetical protein [Vibrio fluvialis]